MMRWMHTKLPEFIQKMKNAALQNKKPKPIEIRGLENLRSAKMQSLRTGRIESAVKEMAERDDVDHIEFTVIPRIPETMHTVVIKGISKDNACTKAILEVVNILHATEEAELADCTDIEDRRPPIGKH